MLFQIKKMSSGQLCKNDFQRYSIAKNIEEALNQYPFQTNNHGISERQLISIIKNQDFEYVGDQILTNHILFNLVKNAIHAIKSFGKGKIIIRLENEEVFNKLIFEDTASGISKDFLPRVFDQFACQTSSQGGTGIGLSFCKMVMQSYDGDITCDSQEGKYTRFVLSFPSQKPL